MLTQHIIMTSRDYIAVALEFQFIASLHYAVSRKEVGEVLVNALNMWRMRISARITLRRAYMSNCLILLGLGALQVMHLKS
jgi:hypothetical protein